MSKPISEPDDSPNDPCLSYKRLSIAAVNELKTGAVNSPRKRHHALWHRDHQDTVQRLAMWFEPQTYVRPHCHPLPGRWEMLILLQGALRVLLFDDQRRVSDVIEMNQDCQLIEIPEGRWHTVVALESSLVFEVKPGPFIAPQPEDFASWAPSEGDDICGAQLDYWRVVQAGEPGHC